MWQIPETSAIGRDAPMRRGGVGRQFHDREDLCRIAHPAFLQDHRGAGFVQFAR
jgi:hypothetical protein